VDRSESIRRHEEQLLHRNLRTREIGPADSVGKIEPHADKNVSCDSCVGMLAENEKLKLDYSICVE
jgi:hypothetical protein